MTDAAQQAIPGPRLRPAPSRALHVVPDRNSEVPTSELPAGAPPRGADAGQVGAPAAASAETSDFGFRVRLAGVWAASRAYWTPPTVFTDPPATLQDLAEYARSAPWTDQQYGIIRAAGVGYYRFVGFPYTVVSRYREWFMQRPMRFVAAAGLIKILSMTGPGGWVVDHLVYPVASAAGSIFL